MLKITPRPWDERRDLIIPGDYIATITFAAEHFITLVHQAVNQHGAFFVALSGGSTPKALYERLTAPPYDKQIPWEKMHLFWSDERSAPPTDPESNYHMAMQAGFAKMPIPKSQIHRMVAEESIQENASAYDTLLKNLNRPLDLVMLGMGEDGHTASLFPHTKGLHSKDRLAIANHIPEKDTWRMTMTFSCINQAKNIAVYALGAAKKYTLAKVLTSPLQYEELPSQNVGTKDHKALWIIDEAAASLLNLSQ